MFTGSRTQNIIPGYTGHIPSEEFVEDILQNLKNDGQIPGYAGYIPSVKAENLFGKTYGRITQVSAVNSNQRGTDISGAEKLKYTSMTKEAYVDQRGFKKEQIKQQQEILNSTIKQQEAKPLNLDSVSNFFGIEQQNKKQFTSYSGLEQFEKTQRDKALAELNSTQVQQKPLTTLTYEQARKIAYGLENNEKI